MKILACGDIHAKPWIVDEIEKLVNNYDAIVFCGDYADNWNTPAVETIKTWEKVKHLSDNNQNVYALIGNHDFAYIHNEISGHSSGWNPSTHAILNFPDNKDIKEWLLSLRITVKIDGVTFSHAGVTNEWDGDISVHGLWNDLSPIWARPQEFGGESTYKDIPQVFGHNPNGFIWYVCKNAICIDTFSERRDNSSIGDNTVLEIIDGIKTNVIKINKNENNNNTSSVKV